MSTREVATVNAPVNAQVHVLTSDLESLATVNMAAELKGKVLTGIIDSIYRSLANQT